MQPQETTIAQDPADYAGRSVRPLRISLGRALWPTLLSLAVVVAIAYATFDLTAFRKALAELNLWLLAAAVASVIARVVLGAWRLRYVSHRQLGFAAAVRAQLAWDFFSNISPSAIGGGPLAAVYISRDQHVGLGDAAAFMLFAMLMDKVFFTLLIPTVLLASSFVPVFPAYLGVVGVGGFITVFAGILVWEVCFGYATLYRPEVLQKAAACLTRLRWFRPVQVRIDREAEGLNARALLLRSQPVRFYLGGMGLTLLTWVAKLSLPLIVVLSVYPQADILLVELRTIAMSLGNLVLPTPGGSGGVEGLYALLIGPLIPPTLVAPTLLTWRFLAYYVFLLAGIYLSMHHLHAALHRRRDRRAPGATGVAGGRYTVTRPTENGLRSQEL
ncbi:MAG TPA: lysylphosphatidylglycerol synthase transmembrane domain-containing protein [Rhodothermales bacterium]|nr:lysylphosphatidylglycerol synthase transmembrane domain-containing protein [Rhodothermales bacterium]